MPVVRGRLNDDDELGLASASLSQRQSMPSAWPTDALAASSPTHGADIIFGSEGSDTINALGGPDQVIGGGGADSLSGGGGEDAIDGGEGNDIIYGFGPADVQPGAGDIVATRVAAGLANPLFAASPPGDPDRLFIVEQISGRIRILDLDTGELNATPFLDIPQDEISRGHEQGLLGLAFHPQYAGNGLFYVYLTNAAGDTEVWEYARATADAANVNSKRLILTFDQPFVNHNGGWMGFGPDGLLYIASGDGGGTGDPDENAQNIDSLLGKVLRIDVNGDDFPEDPNRNYAIPEDNPYVGRAGADEIFMLGLRNPWRMSFDSSGDLYIADVGQGAREEVNWVAAGTGAGFNFGWDFREGDRSFEGAEPEGLVDPVIAYSHGSGPYEGNSITGGYVYHGPGGLRSHYVFGDFASGNLWSARIVDGVAVDFINRNGQLAVDAGDVDQIASFAQDGHGRLYVIGLDGDIHRLTPGLSAADGADFLNGGAGDDRIWAGPGADVVDGGSGADIIRGGAGADWLIGGSGQDIFAYGAASESDFSGYDGIADFTSGEDELDLQQLVADGHSNIAVARFGGSSFVYFGQAGAPSFAGVILASGAEVQGIDLNLGGILDLTFYGSATADALRGASGADTILGGDGDDVILGANGADSLFGGSGADTFDYNTAAHSTTTAWDVIQDFQVGVDRIDLRGVADQVLLSNFGGSTFVYFNPNGAGGYDGLIVAAGVTLTQADVLVTGEAPAAKPDRGDRGDAPLVLPDGIEEAPLILPAAPEARPALDDPLAWSGERSPLDEQDLYLPDLADQSLIVRLMLSTHPERTYWSDWLA